MTRSIGVPAELLGVGAEELGVDTISRSSVSIMCEATKAAASGAPQAWILRFSQGMTVTAPAAQSRSSGSLLLRSGGSWHPTGDSPCINPGEREEKTPVRPWICTRGLFARAAQQRIRGAPESAGRQERVTMAWRGTPREIQGDFNELLADMQSSLPGR
jgi:hypothetical protein